MHIGCPIYIFGSENINRFSPVSSSSSRQVLRDHNCLQTLLGHLRSHSLTIVSNACGTLWNLSARSPRDQVGWHVFIVLGPGALA